MTIATITSRLAVIAREIVQHEAALWRLRGEQLPLRRQLRALNQVSAAPLPLTSTADGASRVRGLFHRTGDYR